jgi:histidinol phosphatase-like PHP family hydrolase
MAEASGLALQPAPDVNFEVASALYDLSVVHSSRHARIAYRRAARSVLSLEQPVSEPARAGTLRAIRNIGPSTERLILEFLDHGHSPTVERAVAGSGREEEVSQARSLRTHFLSRAAVLAILDAPARGIVGRADYGGDLQTHTEWSDGSETVEEMAAAASRRGHRFLGITDHSYGLKIAGGISIEEAARQSVEIDGLNRRERGRFRILKGIEANILADGSLDLTPDELPSFEIVVAAPHSLLRKPYDQTERMRNAVRNRHVHILGHPRGRMLSRRGILADWDAVFEEAARNEVAIEIDGDVYRQDLDFGLARRALERGCCFALDSDAHSGRELVYSEWALAHARLAGIPAGRVINCWSEERLLEWAGLKVSPSTDRRPSRPRRSGA